MTVYRVYPEDYWLNLDKSVGVLRQSVSEHYGFFESRLLTDRPMDELINRYAIKNKRVLSLGPAFGHEEFHFWRYDNMLTFVDIDMYGVIEPYLKSLAPVGPQHECLTFFICDAKEYLRDFAECQFDVVYISGFSPDERRRESVKREFNRLVNYPAASCGASKPKT